MGNYHICISIIEYLNRFYRLLKGGVATGLRKVTDDFYAALFHIKGKRTTVVTELSKVNGF